MVLFCRVTQLDSRTIYLIHLFHISFLLMYYNMFAMYPCFFSIHAEVKENNLLQPDFARQQIGSNHFATSHDSLPA